MKQQIREATAFGVQPRILIHDNDGIYGQFGKDRRSHLGYRSHLDYWLKETLGIRGIPITPGCPQETPHKTPEHRNFRGLQSYLLARVVKTHVDANETENVIFIDARAVDETAPSSMRHR